MMDSSDIEQLQRMYTLLIFEVHVHMKKASVDLFRLVKTKQIISSNFLKKLRNGLVSSFIYINIKFAAFAQKSVLVTVVILHTIPTILHIRSTS
jgi:hypothetical protein